MKRLIFCFFALSFFFTACDEIAPTINPQMDVETVVCDLSVDVSQQEKQVLVEEFTGVNCNNCPKGSRELEDLLAQFGDQLVVVSIHAGSFASPINPEDENLWTQEGEDILSFVGQPLGFPTADVNRVKFDNSFGLQLSPNSKWIGAIELELMKPVTVQIGMIEEYDAATRNLELCVKMYPREDINNEDIRLTVLITESGMVIPQKDNEAPVELVEDYVHKHVLRTTLTAATGNKIIDSFTSGVEISRAFAFDLPQNWVPENCEIIAYVTLNGIDADGNDTREVLQAEQIHLVE